MIGPYLPYPRDQRSRSRSTPARRKSRSSRITIAALSPTTNPVVWWAQKTQAQRCETVSVIPKSGNRFSDKIMLGM
jgi:hypothetical protein